MRGARMGALVRARDGWLPGEMVQRGAKRDHNRSLKMTVGSGCSRPYELTPPTAKSPEGMPQKCAAGRDAVQIAERKEVVFKSWIPFPPFLHFLHYSGDRLGADGEGAGAWFRAGGRKDFRERAFESEQSAREPGGRKIEIARRGNIPEHPDGP